MRFRIVVSDCDATISIVAEDNKGNVIAVAEKLTPSDSDLVELEGFFSELNYGPDYHKPKRG